MRSIGYTHSAKQKQPGVRNPHQAHNTSPLACHSYIPEAFFLSHFFSFLSLRLMAICIGNFLLSFPLPSLLFLPHTLFVTQHSRFLSPSLSHDTFAVECLSIDCLLN
eukprot:00327_5